MALLGFHAFTGCDLTGRFRGISKTTCFDTFFKSNSFVYKSSLGNNEDGLKEEITDGLTQFILDLYQSKRPSNINTLCQLRCYLFSKFQYDSENLPPTSSALCFVIYRSHLVCNTWKKSLFPAPLYLILKNMVGNTIPTTTTRKQFWPINWLLQNKLWNYVFANVKQDLNLYDVAAKRIT